MATRVRLLSKIQLGGELKLNSGVKQGDPLSPIPFNLVIDELICRLQGTGLGIKVSAQVSAAVLGYADDLVLLAKNHANAQKLLRTATKFFEERGLDLNPHKCFALSVGENRSNHIIYTISRSMYSARGKSIKQLNPLEFGKYLGSKYDQSGHTQPTVKDLKLQLARIAAAPLKPAQKLSLLKQFLIPKLLHSFQSLRIKVPPLEPHLPRRVHSCSTARRGIGSIIPSFAGPRYPEEESTDSPRLPGSGHFGGPGTAPQ